MNNKDKELLKKLGLKVKIERVKLNLTQEKLAEIADISKLSIGSIERGEVSPKLLTINALAKAFKLSLPEMFDF